METTASLIRLLLVSQQRLCRSALASLLSQRPSIRVVGDGAGTLQQGEAQATAHTPDIILLEMRPGSELGIHAIPRLASAAGPQARVVLLSGQADPALQRDALHNGARGIVDFDHHPDLLFKAIERVHDGEVWMDRKTIADLATGYGRPDPIRERITSLTPREREVVLMVTEGLRNKQIAERLSIADVTVRHHLTSIFSKLEVADRLSLVVFAFQHGVADPPQRRHH